MLLHENKDSLAEAAEDAAAHLSRLERVEAARLRAGALGQVAEWERLGRILESGLL